MKNVLLLVHDDLGQEARVEVALAVTRALRGHLHCLDVSLVPRAIDCPYDGVGVGILVNDEVTREADNKARVQERLGREHVAWSWADVTDSFEHALRRAALLADLVVVSRKLTCFPFPDMRRTASDLVVTAHRPILAVPDTPASFEVFGHALVAWDGSPTACAAMMAATPLLSHARKITLFEIDDGSVDVPAREAAAYLMHHGIRAQTVRDRLVGVSVAKMLLDVVTSHGADYLVMGGYSHYRATEMIFGGVTRTMLTESPVPVLLMH